MLITSEEQFKLFLLPQLKPCGKYKLTAHEGIRQALVTIFYRNLHCDLVILDKSNQNGLRVRRVKSATFASTRDAEYTENCLVYLANSGEIGVLSLPELRRQASVSLGHFPTIGPLPVGELICCEERGRGGDQLVELLQHGQRDLLELKLGAAADLSLCQAHCGRGGWEGGGGEEGGGGGRGGGHRQPGR